jgi:hypothetical protein
MILSSTLITPQIDAFFETEGCISCEGICGRRALDAVELLIELADPVLLIEIPSMRCSAGVDRQLVPLLRLRSRPSLSCTQTFSQKAIAGYRP